MTKRILLAFAAFLVLGSVVVWMMSASIDETNKEDENRTEADFVSQKFAVSELWEQQLKNRHTVLTRYIFLKVKNSPVLLRLPYAAGKDTKEQLLQDLAPGDTVMAKVIKTQLEAAERGGAGRAVLRWLKGDKREVTVYKLTLPDGQVLIERDIHEWDEARITWLQRLTDQAFLLIIALLPLLFVAAIVGRKRRAALARNQQ